MITFIECKTAKHPILINWKQIILIQPTTNNKGTVITMSAGQELIITNSFNDVRSRLRELDKQSQIISSAAKENDCQ